MSIEEVVSAFKRRSLEDIVRLLRKIHDAKTMVLADAEIYGRERDLREAARYHAYSIVLMSILHEQKPVEDGSLNSIDERLALAFREGLGKCSIDIKLDAEDYIGKFYNPVVEELNNVVREICRRSGGAAEEAQS